MGPQRDIAPLLSEFARPVIPKVWTREGRIPQAVRLHKE